MAKEIFYPELSYKIVGILFDVHNQLGCRYQEKYYQRAAALAFTQAGLKYKQELKIDLKYANKIIGKYFIDFLVEGKIVVEFKTVDRLKREDIRQVLGYLKAYNLKLGLLVNFRKERLEMFRVLNSEVNS